MASRIRVVLTRRVRDQLAAAPPELQGYVAGIIAVLRVEPGAVTAAFEAGPPDATGYRIAVIPGGRGLLAYWVLQERRVVVLLDLLWL